MATLFNTKISATYEGLFKTIDNAAITASLKELTDGSGNQSGLYVNNAGDFKVSNILEWGSLKDTGTGVTITRYVTSTDGIENFDNNTSLPTSAAVKLYVDSKFATSDTLQEVLSFGNTTSGNDIVVSANDDITFTDSSKAIFGAGIDLQIYHDGTNSYVKDIGSGSLVIQSSDLFLRTNNTENALVAAVSGSVTLYYNNIQKFQTTDTGATITGRLSGLTDPTLAQDAATKSYVDALDAGSDLDFKGDNGTAGVVNLNTQRLDILGTANQITTVSSGQSLTIGMPTNVTISGIVNATTFNGNVTGDVTGDLTGTASLINVTSATVDQNERVLLSTGVGSQSVLNDSGLLFNPVSHLLTVNGSGTFTGDLNVTGNITGGGGSFLPLAGGTMTGDTIHNDNVKSIYGTGSDFSIYHDGSNSYIDNNTGALLIRETTDNADVIIQSDNGGGGLADYFRADGSTGASILYHLGSEKLSTISTGISVTGNGVFSGNVSVPDSAFLYAGSSDDLSLTHNGTDSIIRNYTGDLQINQGAVTQSIVFKVSDANSLDTTALTISRNADASFGRDVIIAGDLTVNGTTTTVNSQTLAVVDPLIQLAKDNTANSLDIGLYGDYNDGTDRFLGLFSDASDSNKFKLFKGTTVEPTTTVDIGGAGYEVADLLVGDFEASTGVFNGGNGGNGQIDLFRTSGANIRIQAQASLGRIGTSSNHDFILFTNDTTRLTIDNTNATFAGNITTNGYLTLQGQATPQIFMTSNTVGTPNWTLIAGTNGYFTIGRSGVANDFYFDPNGNATFSGDTNVLGSLNAGATTLTSNDENILKLVNSAGQPSLIRFNDTSTTTDPYIGSYGNDLAFGTYGGGEKMRIDSSGNVGIGVGNPSSFGRFVVQGTGNLLNLNATSGKVYQAFYENGVGRFYLNTLNGSDGLAFTDADGSTERMRIDSSGNVGINVVPTNKLHIKDENPYGGITIQGNNAPALTLNDTSDTAISQIYAQNGGILRIVADVNNVTTTASVELHVGGVERFRVFDNGNIQMGNVTTSVSNPQSWGHIFQVRNDGTNGSAISVTDANNEYNLATYGGNFLLSTGAEERLVIKNAGQFGINVNNPLFELCIANGGTPNRNSIEFAVSATDTGTNILQNYNRATAAYTPMNLAAKFLTIGTGTAATQRILLDANGRFGLSGTNTITAPSYLHQINQQSVGSALNYLDGTAITFGNNGYAAIHDNPTANNTIEAGIRLQNNSSDNGAYSPLIAFSAKSASASFNHTYAAIFGEKTQSGADSNWTRGDIIFSTSAGTGPNERMRLDEDGQLGIGTKNFQTDGRPQKPLHIESGSGSQVLISAADDTVGTTAGIVFRTEGGEANGLARIKGGIFFERIAGTYGNGNLHLANDLLENNNEVTAANKRLSINADGTISIIGAITDQAGARTFTKGGSMLNNTAYTFDIAVPQDTGTGTVHHVDAMMTHYDTSYGCVLNCYAYTRGTQVSTQTNLLNQFNANAGQWTVTKPNNTTLRITKTAGTYPGTGFYQIRVLTKTP